MTKAVSRRPKDVPALRALGQIVDSETALGRMSDAIHNDAPIIDDEDDSVRRSSANSEVQFSQPKRMKM